LITAKKRKTDDPKSKNYGNIFDKSIKIMSAIVAAALLTMIIIVLSVSIPLDNGFFLKPINHFDTDSKIVALTFDDGPSKQWTPLLLDLLKKYSVKATFFIVGEKIIMNKELALRIQREGHAVGQHTYYHNRMIFKSQWFIRNDLKKMDELFQSVGLEKTVYFRPPYGSKLLSLPYELKRSRKIMITWNVESKAQYDRDSIKADEISSYIIKNTKPGSIILLHDGWSGDPKPFLKTVEKTITGLKKKGYKFVTVEEGLRLYRSGSKNNFRL
jgi:peptidoglycan/xylan/chitin deacetylase (PgdA/CDA1 family)